MDWLRLNPHDAIARWRRWERCWTSSRHGRPSSWDFAVKKPPQKIFFFKNSTYTKIVIIYIYYIQYIIHQKHHTKIVVKLFSLNRFDHFGGDYFIDAYIYKTETSILDCNKKHQKNECSEVQHQIINNWWQVSRCRSGIHFWWYMQSMGTLKSLNSNISQQWDVWMLVKENCIITTFYITMYLHKFTHIYIQYITFVYINCLDPLMTLSCDPIEVSFSWEKHPVGDLPCSDFPMPWFMCCRIDLRQARVIFG